MILATLFLLSFGASLLFTCRLERVGAQYFGLDIPRTDRFHLKPVTRLGGASFFFIPIGFVFMLSPFIDLQYQRILAVTIPATIAYLGGLMDDLKCANRVIEKLIFQALTAISMIYFLESPFATKIIYFLLTVFMMNSMNLMDNMNGLSGGLALVFLTFFGCLAQQNALATMPEYVVLVIFIGSLMGFLIRNFPNAKIFMGDQGSQLLGFFVTFVFLQLNERLLISQKHADPYSILKILVLSIIVFFPFVYDTLSVIFIRIKQGKPIYIGDTQHLSHRLVKRGRSPQFAVILIILIQALSLAVYVIVTRAISQLF